MWFDIHKANISKLVVSCKMLSVWSRGYFTLYREFCRELLFTHSKKIASKERKFCPGGLPSNQILIALGVL